MKKWFILLISILFPLILVLGYILNNTGIFRNLELRNTFSSYQTINLPGAEDIAISNDRSFLIISSDDRAARRDGNPKQGGLYLLRLNSSQQEPILLTQNFNRPFYPHGISLLAIDSAVYRIWAINHVDDNHSIEVFDLIGDSLIFKEQLIDDLIVSPNDLVAIGPNSFYLTNDHKYVKGFPRFLEDYLALRQSNVIYFDGINYKQVARNIAYANGINYDPFRKLMFVASPRDFLVKVYYKNVDGALDFIEDIDTGTGVDNIEFDPFGKLWIGCHPKLLTFASYAKGKRPITPSEIITIDYRGKKDYAIESIFVDDGSLVAGSTIAIPVDDRLYVGNVMDSKLLVLVK